MTEIALNNLIPAELNLKIILWSLLGQTFRVSL